MTKAQLTSRKHNKHDKNTTNQGRSQKKLMTEAMSMEDLWPRQSVHGWVLFLGIKSVYNDYKKQKWNYRGKCLGSPVTSYGDAYIRKEQLISQKHNKNDKNTTKMTKT